MNDTMPTPLPRGPVVLHEEGHSFRRYAIRVPEGVTIEHVCTPRWWVAVAARLEQGDRIEVIAEDMTWMASLIVLATNRSEAFVQVLEHHALSLSPVAAEASPYVVKHAGRGSYRVHSTATNAVVKDGFPDKRAAEQWVANHLKAA
jgi:hypothetical protein